MAFAYGCLDNVNYFFTLVRSSMAPNAESVASADWRKGKTGIRRDEDANHLHLLLDGEAAEVVLQIGAAPQDLDVMTRSWPLGSNDFRLEFAFDGNTDLENVCHNGPTWRGITLPEMQRAMWQQHHSAARIVAKHNREVCSQNCPLRCSLIAR